MVDSATSSAPVAPKAGDDFYNRHSSELGVGQFARIQARNFFVPLITAAIPGALGYFALGKPLSKLKVVQGFEIAEDFAKNFSNIKLSDIQEAGPKLSEVAGGALGRLQAKDPEFKIESISSIRRLLKEATLEEYEAIRGVFGVTKNEDPLSRKLAGAAALGVPGLMAGSVAIGYDEWRKQETPRVAAREIGRDISNLELFRPSDKELVSENRRLRAMLADMPDPVVKEAEYQGKPEAKIATGLGA